MTTRKKGEGKEERGRGKGKEERKKEEGVLLSFLLLLLIF